MTDGINAETTSCDGFLDNKIKVFQPRKGAHRSGLDALLLAATIPVDATGLCADFGAGSGVAGFVVAKRCAGLNVALFERDPTMAALCKASRDLAQNAEIAERIAVFKADLTARGRVRSAQGLADNQFTHVIANPPYNNATQMQASPAALRSEAHVMDDDLLQTWCETARMTLRHRGNLHLILRPNSLAQALTALEPHFGNIRIRPVHSKLDKQATRMLIAATKHSRSQTQILPGFTIHRNEGQSFTDQAEAIFRGQAGIDMN